MTADHNHKTNILGSWISTLNLSDTCDRIYELSKTNQSHYICISNVHTVVMGNEDPTYANVTNEASLATADGVPLIWASKFLGENPIQGRACGPDILENFINNPKFESLKHYFYGSTPDVIEQLKTILPRLNPKLICVGFESPPFRKAFKKDDPLTVDEKTELDRIEQSGADLIWVGLGAPKQEIFMSRAKQYLKRGVLLGAGAAFDFISGNKKRAPHWMQSAGLEWAYRLSSEPKRLFKRYAETNPKFIYKILKSKISR